MLKPDTMQNYEREDTSQSNSYKSRIHHMWENSSDEIAETMNFACEKYHEFFYSSTARKYVYLYSMVCHLRFSEIPWAYQSEMAFCYPYSPERMETRNYSQGIKGNRKKYFYSYKYLTAICHHATMCTTKIAQWVKPVFNHTQGRS